MLEKNRFNMVLTSSDISASTIFVQGVGPSEDSEGKTREKKNLTGVE